MKTRKTYEPLWVAVKVERGYLSRASLFDTRSQAQTTVRRWHKRLNPDYDEAAVIQGRISASVCRALLRRLVSTEVA
jgi:hypothetical protein